MKLFRLITQDISFLLRFVLPVKIGLVWLQWRHRGRWNLMELWERNVDRFGDRTALEFGERSWTYRELDRLAASVADRLVADGTRVQERVARFGENHPAFLSHALGIMKCGATPVILRPGFDEERLSFFLEGYDRLSRLFVSESYADSVPRSVRSAFERVVVYDLAEPASTETSAATDHRLRRRPITLWDECFHIGTSGTGRFSKACKVHQGTFYAFLLAHRYMKRLTRRDKTYCCVTLSHGEGFAVGCFSAWSVGAAVHLAERFDPETFMSACTTHAVTVLSYVGTIPRRLLQQPPGAQDRQHGIRVAGGHEMLPTIWGQFSERFGIERIAEYYASTEGTVLFYNDTRPGAVGFCGPLTRRVYPFAILRLDDDHDLVVRDGEPVRCEPGEAGELFGLINAEDPLNQMDSYQNEALEEGRVLRSLLREGDCWYRTGDLLRHDRDGYLYFIGKLPYTHRVDGLYVNPQIVEDRIMAAMTSLATAGTFDCLAFFAEGTDGGKILGLKVRGSIHLERPEWVAWLEGVLEPREYPVIYEWGSDPIPYTHSLRRQRSGGAIPWRDLLTRDEVYRATPEGLVPLRSVGRALAPPTARD
jgi:fatty-acyl-CoA synthase